MLRIARASGSPESYYNSIAGLYDHGKKKNLYYFDNLVSLYRFFIPTGRNILEIGCGTGDLITKLDAREALGIDLSAEMIKTAQRKYHNLKKIRFERMDITSSSELFRTEYIMIVDVLEHVIDVPKFIKQVYIRAPREARVIISVANPIWEPFLMLAEKLRMKIPEGPHKRLTIKKTEEIYGQAGFLIEQKGYRLLVPKRLPFSDWINERFYRSRLMGHLGLVVFWVLVKRT